MRRSIIVVFALLAACGPERVVPSRTPLAPVSVSGPHGIPASALPAEERLEISTLMAETIRILRSPTFDRNMRAVEEEFGQIAQSAFGGRLPAGTVADLMAGRDPRYRFSTVLVEWGELEHSTTFGRGLISLNANVRANWQATDPRTRSLAINSMAHEFSHTLSSKPDRLVMIFTDSGYKWAWLRGRPPVASYTIGSVAQCSWLEEQGAMPEGLTACLRRYGVRRFTP